VQAEFVPFHDLKMHRYTCLRFCINIGASLLLALGLTVILGWYIGSERLIQIYPQFVPMQFNTALGFVLMSLALMGLANNLRGLVKYLGIAAILLGGLTLIQHIFVVNLHIDELFMKHYITIATSQPGRMAPNTALNFLLSGLAILIMSTMRIRLTQIIVGSFLGSVTMGLGVVAFLGYLSNIETAYGWGNLTKMAIHTAIGFIIVGLILLLEARYLSLKAQQKTPSVLLPLILSVLGFTITICLWQALHSAESYIGIKPKNFVAEGILIFGGLFSVVIAIAVWFAIRSREQLRSLRLAQEEILILNQQLEKISYLDGLTEIPNRRSFDAAIEKELGRAFRYQHSIAVILLDIDYFKAYNDHYGHQMGDYCLQKVAQTINSMAQRKTDMAARYGGEEFVLLLPDAMTADAEKIAAMTLQAIADLNIPHEKSKVSSFVTISAGISVCVPSTDTTIKELIYHADQALYEAKAQGRARIIATKF
jgi:diguanylate cyclase (GGDEF)-like protein